MGRTIQDEFTNLPVSRQRKGALRRVRDGKCAVCGKPREHYAHFCDEHQIENRRRRRPVRVSRKGRKCFVLDPIAAEKERVA